ncbi:hypothetical protein AURDEDRAFT_163323 [Auricularia subglabra TFB-10046 SS5]|nr:hypothetical protein AURDEDRAFT_163323 [Auricularia subglabra TFB-10046 SS5]
MLSSFISAARRRRETAERSLALLEQRAFEVHLALDDAEVALRMASATVAALTSERDDIQAKCREFQRTIQGVPSTFDPRILERMPVELLRAVFEEAALGLTPFWMVAVCRRWRTVAIATPAIWTYVALPLLKKPSASTLLSYKAHIGTLLDMSKACPIDVLLEWDEDTPRWTDPDMEVCRDIVASVTSNVSRWSHVILTLPAGIDLTGVDFLRNPMPALDELSFATHDSDMLPWEDFPNYVPQSPRLMGLYLGTIFPYPRSPLLSLVDAGITVGDQPADAIWHTLSMMPSLRELEIGFMVPEDLTLPPPEPPASQLCLRSLRSLSLLGYPTVADSWATRLELPQLESLTLPIGFCDSFTHLLPATCSAAKRLTLVDEVASQDLQGFKLALAEMQPLEILAAVTHFTLMKATLGPTFCDRLRGENGASIWPKLESVILDNVLFAPVAAERFVEFVKARVSACKNSSFTVVMKGPSRPSWLKAQLAAVMNERFVSEDGDVKSNPSAAGSVASGTHGPSI